MTERLVTVARFDNYIEAELAKQRLEDEGVTAFVMGQNVGNVYGGVPAVLDIELQTPESQAEQARQILEANATQKDGQSEMDEDWESDEDWEESEDSEPGEDEEQE
jgi:hypothetical protein